MFAFTILLLFFIGNEASSISKGSSLKIPYDLRYAADIFDDFQTKFKKVYKSAEEYSERFSIFKDNLNMINKLNKKSNTTFKFNQFSDLTFKEFNKMYLAPDNLENVERFKIYSKAKYLLSIPAELDYRQWGYVSSVKDQGSCGAGYAFAAAGAVEGQLIKQLGEYGAVVSAQQGIDCNNYDMECDGGYSSLGIASLTSIFGVMLEEDYPYLMRGQEECYADTAKAAVQLAGAITVLTRGNNDILKIALYDIGPLAIDIDVCPAFIFYSGGIFNEPCIGNQHSVLVVGYGAEVELIIDT